MVLQVSEEDSVQLFAQLCRAAGSGGDVLPRVDVRRTDFEARDQAVGKQRFRYGKEDGAAHVLED